MRTTFGLALLLILTAGCDGDSSVDAGAVTDAGSEPPPDPLRADCEALNPEYCALPFPSDYWLADDPTTRTGHRLAVGQTTLPAANVRRKLPIEPGPINERDGWSVNASILAFLPGATATGLPSPVTIARSLEDDSPTVLLDAATGERVPHFSEIDESVLDPQTDRTFIIRPVVPLAHSTRYIVAVRSVVDASGGLVPPPAPFAALRDGGDSGVDTIEARRDHFEEIFTTLEGHGVARDDLQLAWDFTTGSLENDTAWLVTARDRALAAVGPGGPDFRIDTIEELTMEEDANIARRVHGTMTVPLFLDQPEAGAVLNLDGDGLPAQNGTAEYPFLVNVPRSATPDTPVQPLQFGHGLLGSRIQANAGYLSRIANEHGFAVFAVNWIGMAEDDIAEITRSLSNGTLQGWRTVPERGVQGIVNFMLAMRMMLGGFAEHPDMLVGGRPIIDTSAGYYIGASQGGIFGGTLMSVSTDVTRGVLAVPGQPYQLLLNRSVDFDPYVSLQRIAFDDGPDIQVGLSYMQLLWDRAEPGSFTRHIRQDLFEGTPAHEVLIMAAIGDHQVTTLGAHVMARAIGAQTIAPQTRAIWGIEEATPPHMGSGIVEYDFGLPPEPTTNVPLREGDDPHNDLAGVPEALDMAVEFMRTGAIDQVCDGVCDPT